MLVNIQLYREFLSGESINHELRLVEKPDGQKVYLFQTTGVGTIQMHGKEIINVPKDRQMSKLPDRQIITWGMPRCGSYLSECDIRPYWSLILPLEISLNYELEQL